MRTLNEWADVLGPWNRAYKSKKERTIPFMFAHLHEEVAEAWKEWREGRTETTWHNVTKHGKRIRKPEGLGAELADAVIMAIIIAEDQGINLDVEIGHKWGYLQARLDAKKEKK